jgi:hypothetical protein
MWLTIPFVPIAPSRPHSQDDLAFAPPSPLCEGAFFFRVKVRYLVGKLLTGVESLSQLW